MAVHKEVQLLFCALFCTIFHISNASNPTVLTRSLKSEFLCEHAPMEQNGTFPNLLHVSAAGPEDVLHYFVSTIGMPGMLVLRTTLDSKLYFDEEELCSNKYPEQGFKAGLIHTSPKPLYAFSVLLPVVYEYNDTHDLADLEKIDQDDRALWKFHEMDNLQWLPSHSISGNGTHSFYFNVTSNSTRLERNHSDPFIFRPDGYFSLKFDFYATQDRSDLLPHLEFNANNTQISLSFNNISTAFENSRFGLQLMLITSDTEKEVMNLDTTKSIDDEHSPGVFEMIDWTSEGQKQTEGAYMQWKPVCYKNPDRDFNSATKQFYYDLEHVNKTDWILEHTKVSIAAAYFGADAIVQEQLLMATANVSYGLSKDNFYRSTNYTTWTFSVGFGTPPADAVSTMIKLVISIGLGLPVVLIVFGGVFVCVKNYRKKEQEMSSSYSPIQ